MKANLGSIDKAIRLLIAIFLIILFYKEIITGVIGVIGLCVALLLTVTSLISYCPIYAIFKINTANPTFKKEGKKEGMEDDKKTAK